MRSSGDSSTNAATTVGCGRNWVWSCSTRPSSTDWLLSRRLGDDGSGFDADEIPAASGGLAHVDVFRLRRDGTTSPHVIRGISRKRQPADRPLFVDDAISSGLN